MTSPAPSGGGPTPLRVGGLALVGVAVVSAIIGLATLATGGGQESTPTAAPAPTATVEPAPPPEAAPPTSLPTVGGDVPVPSFTPPPPEGNAAPAPAPGAQPTPDNGNGNNGNPSNGSGNDRAASGGDSPAVVRAPLRVYNNSRVEGLAAQAAEDFRRGGWEVTDIGAYGDGIIPVTTVYYRPGTGEEAPARALADQFGLRVMPRFDGLRDASPGIIVIVTREYAA